MGISIVGWMFIIAIPTMVLDFYREVTRGFLYQDRSITERYVFQALFWIPMIISSLVNFSWVIFIITIILAFATLYVTYLKDKI